MGRPHQWFFIITGIALLTSVLGLAGQVEAPLTLPIRINCGGPSVGDPKSRDYWQSDAAFAVHGKKFAFKQTISTEGCDHPAPAAVYQTVRRDNPAYRFPGLPDGVYLVRLHFSDFILKGKDERSMNFWLQDCKLLEDFSVIRAAGGNARACVVEFVIEATHHRGLEIHSSRGTGNDAFIAGIEIRQARKRDEPSIEQDLSPARPVNLADRVREFGQGPVRLVWCRGNNPKDAFSLDDEALLCGFDTEDGRGERIILDRAGYYAKPMLTPDGSQVIFTDQKSKRCYAVGFDGHGLREICKGFASDVWDDPKTHARWLYVREGEGEATTMVRRQLQKPEVVETVWSAGETGQAFMSYFRVSRDGETATDCFPWPNVGLADISNRKFRSLGNGCWPDIAPDGSGRHFFFRGNHASINIFDNFGPKNRRVSLDTVGGWENKPVFHPRWSRHPRYLTVTAPEARQESELYLGRFDEDYTRVEAWRRITYNDKPERFGDAWFGNNPSATREPIPALIATTKENIPGDAADRHGLIFVWENQRADNAITDAAGKTLRLCRATLTGRSRPSFSQGADLRDGALVPDAESSKAVVSAVQKSKALSLGFVTEAGRADFAQPTVVACLGNAAQEPLLVVWQKKDILSAEYLAADGNRRELILGKVSVGKPQHWQLTLDAAHTAAFADGLCVARISSAPAFDQWQTAELRFGSDGTGHHPWSGRLEGIEIFARTLSEEEITRRHVSLQKTWSARKPIHRIEVNAELLQSSKASDPDAIRPYRRSLAENIYRVRKASGGDLKSDRIVVLQWCILDGSKQTTAPKPGSIVKLNLESADDHPELSGEHRSTDIFEPDLPVFYDLDS